MSNQQTNTNLCFFSVEHVFGTKKLVDINNGDFFPFSDEAEIENTKQILTNVYGQIEITRANDDNA